MCLTLHKTFLSLSELNATEISARALTLSMFFSSFDCFQIKKKKSHAGRKELEADQNLAASFPRPTCVVTLQGSFRVVPADVIMGPGHVTRNQHARPLLHHDGWDASPLH